MLHPHGVSNTLALTGPGTISKNLVVAKVRSGPGAEKSYLTSVLFASRYTVTGKVPENYVIQVLFDHYATVDSQEAAMH